MVARSLLFVATLAAVGSLRAAATSTWTGAGGDNEWTNTLNWTESKVPGIGDTAVFTNAAPLSLRIDRPSGYDLGTTNYRFLGADVTIGSSNTENAFFIFGSATSTVEVVAGTTVTCSNYVQMYNSDNMALAKKGGGTFRFVYKNNYVQSLKQLVVDEGRVERVKLSNGSHVLTSDIRVGSGAEYSSSGYSTFYSNGGGLLLDGGIFSVGLSAVQSWWYTTSTHPDVEIGEGGGTLRAVDFRDSYNSDNCIIRMYGVFKSESGVTADGGVAIDLRDSGVGFMPLAPFLVNGPVAVKDGRLLLSKYGNSEYADLENYPSFFGTGDFILDCSLLDYNDTNGNLAEGTLRLASGAGSVMRVRGSSEIRFRANTSKNVQHVVVGADGAAADSAFARERGGALFLHDAGQAFDGEKSTLKVNGGVATNALSTLVKAPVFTEDATIASAGDVYPLCYDAEKGFVKFTNFATDLTAGEDKVVRPASALPANATAHVAAIQLVNWGSVTLNAGSRLTIGNGVDPACVMLGYETDIKGSGTIDFGASEGVVAVGPCGGDDYGHSVSVSFSGSGGMSYVSRPNFARRVVQLTGASDYTGDTHISVAAIRVQNSSAFSSGDVYVEGGYRNGGKLIFDTPLTLGNNLHVSGGGHRLHQWRNADDTYGAISFEASGVTLAGNVELMDRTEVAASASGEGTFAGVISGDRLVVKPGEGSIILAANNTYTGGTEVVSAKIALAGTSPSLGTGRVKLDDGIVSFENTSPIAFANTIEGTGTFKVRRAAVTFTVPQINNGLPMTAARGTRIEFANGVATVIGPKGMAIVFR